MIGAVVPGLRSAPGGRPAPVASGPASMSPQVSQANSSVRTRTCDKSRGLCKHIRDIRQAIGKTQPQKHTFSLFDRSRLQHSTGSNRCHFIEVTTPQQRSSKTRTAYRLPDPASPLRRRSSVRAAAHPAAWFRRLPDRAWENRRSGESCPRDRLPTHRHSTNVRKREGSRPGHPRRGFGPW